MKKRILSMVLCLCMVVSLFPQAILLTSAAEENVVSIKYYADAALTQEISEVKKDDEFYAAVSFNKFTNFYQVTLTVGYDTEYLQLLDETGKPAVIDNGDAFIKNKGYIDQRNIGRVKVNGKSVIFPKLFERNGIAMVTMAWSGLTSDSITSDTVGAVLRFKAIKSGKTTLTIPSKLYDDVYDEDNRAGLDIIAGADYDIILLDDCTVNISSMEICCGDINADGELNTCDVVALRRYLAGGYDISVDEEMLDVNGDGRLNVRDVVALRNLIAN